MALNFLKTGAASAQMAKQDEVAREQRKEAQNKSFRFWLKEKEEARITFVDGDLSPEGFLIPPRFYEHMLYLNGEWTPFVCPELTMPDNKEKCPICESGDRPALVALFTIIDHRTFKSKDGSKTYVNTRKLLVAKPQSFELLNKLAVKRGGLAGCTFDASRVGDKSASIGSMFDFVEKKSIEELKPLFMVEKTNPTNNAKVKETYFVPLDYEKEIVFRDAATLVKMGLGKPSEQAATMVSSPAGASASPQDYSSQL